MQLLTLERIWAELDLVDPAEGFRLSQRFTILAFGKLGGRELNYSSDIDLFGIYDQPAESDREKDARLYQQVMEKFRGALSAHVAGLISRQKLNQRLTFHER